MEKIAITISREYGCGAREVGERLAKRLAVPYYDRDLVKKTAELSGFTEEFIKKKEQSGSTDSFWSLGSAHMGFTASASISDQIYLAQCETIIQIADTGSCVIVGRCADAILKDSHNCLRVFLHADDELREKRIVEVYGVDPTIAGKKIRETDKNRAKHYKHYCEGVWGSAKNYDLSINMAKFEIDSVVDMIIDALGEKIK